MAEMKEEQALELGEGPVSSAPGGVASRWSRKRPSGRAAGAGSDPASERSSGRVSSSRWSG